jgi:hypothetical protein
MKGLKRSLSRGGNQGVVRRSVFRLADLAIEVDGATGVGFGSAVLGDLPEGNILLLGAIAYLQFTKGAGATGVQDAFDGDYSVGTTATADATLSGTDVNVIPSSALGAATSGVSPVARGANGTPAMLDNTDGSLELNLNLLIDDANISADDQGLTAEGYVELLYSVMGDD